MLESQSNKNSETETQINELKWKMKVDKISYDVLIPARDEEETIKRTLDCLNKQSIRPDSIIVVN